jgi:hypothetical protein
MRAGLEWCVLSPPRVQVAREIRTDAFATRNQTPGKQVVKS